jgi:hypothetical protein
MNVDDLQNFTVFIKTIVTFSQYNVKMFVYFVWNVVLSIIYLCRRTVKDDTNFLCRFNRKTDPRCPIFSIGYILKNLQDQDSKINLKALYHKVNEFKFVFTMNFSLFLKGALIEIQQNWKCNFDFDKQKKECFPIWTFNLLQSGSDQQSPGINYR